MPGGTLRTASGAGLAAAAIIAGRAAGAIGTATAGAAVTARGAGAPAGIVPVAGGPEAAVLTLGERSAPFGTSVTVRTGSTLPALGEGRPGTGTGSTAVGVRAGPTAIRAPALTVRAAGPARAVSRPAGGRTRGTAVAAGCTTAALAGDRTAGPTWCSCPARRSLIVGPPLVVHRDIPFEELTCRNIDGDHLSGPRRLKMSGDVLLSHAVTRAVPSAQKGLASGFGMGPGVSPSPWSPKLYGDVVVKTTAPREPHSGRVAFVVKSSAY
jgi:hypothetical protein